MNHASDASREKISSVFFIVARSSITCAHFSHRSAGIGTPHARWREMVQSGRVSVMLRMRSRAHGGTQVTASISDDDLFAQLSMIDVDEPLLGSEKNQWRVGPPAMRIAMRVGLAMKQRADCF